MTTGRIGIPQPGHEDTRTATEAPTKPESIKFRGQMAGRLRRGGAWLVRLLLTMLSAVAEFERDLVVERTRLGLVNARRAGRRLGRPPVLLPVAEKVQQLKASGETWAEIASTLKCTVWAARMAARATRSASRASSPTARAAAPSESPAARRVAMAAERPAGPRRSDIGVRSPQIAGPYHSGEGPPAGPTRGARRDG
jgi:hypothetical protein